jgi:hypothetical protein
LIKDEVILINKIKHITSILHKKNSFDINEDDEEDNNNDEEDIYNF